MTRICESCGFENRDDYDFCAKCGNPLVEGLEPNNVIVLKAESVKVNQKAILLSYIVTIVLSWSGFIVGLISKSRGMAAFTFFGFFMPFYLIQSPIPAIKRHGIIQLFISLVGVAISFYVMLK